MKKVLLWGVLAGSVLGAAAGQAEAAGVGLKASTLGTGVALAVPLTDSLSGRIDLNRYSYGTSLTESGIRYHADLKWRSAGAFLDWHPFGGTFRLSVGYLANDNQVDVRASGTQTVGNTTYSNVDLNGKVDFNSGGYVGIGWGNAGTRGWAFLADIGVLFQGSPHVSLTDRSGTVSATDLNREAADAEHNLKDLNRYPVASIGIAYGF